MSNNDWLNKIKNKDYHPHHHHINMLLVITVLLIIILAILIKPALIGYKMSKQFEEINMSVSEFMKELDIVKSNLLISETNLKSCKSLNNQYLEDVAAEKNQTFICYQEKSELQSEYNQLSAEFSFNITRINSEFEQKKNEIQINLTQSEMKFNELKTITDAVIINAANNICCKSKVDNKNIDSYLISNGVIICTSGEKDKIIC